MRIALRLLPLFAVVAIVATLQGVRLRRVLELSRLPEWSIDAPSPDRASPTGYTAGRRRLLINDPTGQSQQWIAQTQQAMASGMIRIHHVDYDNAPTGRESHLSLLYRAWLLLLTRADSMISGAPAGLAAERASLYADPLLQLAFVLVTGWWVARKFGRFAAILVSIALLALHPLSTAFLPGLPHPLGLSLICAVWSILPLVAGFSRPTNVSASTRHAFLLAGVAGGLGLSLTFPIQLSIIIGTGLGALLLVASKREHAFPAPTPWRIWSLAGAAVSLLLYACDYFPDELNLRLEANHPLYAIGWLALGELLTAATMLPQRSDRALRTRAFLRGSIAAVSLAVVVTFALSRHPSVLASDLGLTQLTRIDGGFASASLARWFSGDGGAARLWSTLLPAVLLIAAVIRRLWHGSKDPTRPALLFILGPLGITLIAALGFLRWWSAFDAVAIAVLAVAVQGRSARQAWAWTAAAVMPTVLGLAMLVPPPSAFQASQFEPAEIQLLLERDLAQWLAERDPGAIVLAPPAITTALWYYGGIRGVTTFDSANREGLMGALHIAGATTPQEAQVLLQKRQVSHVVLPSWDLGLDDSAKEISGSTKSLFIEQLRGWILPTWTRPIAYYLPPIAGFEKHSVAVFERGDEQPEYALICQMATYFVEAGLPGHASELRPYLRRFPHELGPAISLAEIERVRDDPVAFAAAIAALDPLLESGAAQRISFERRIALATVLAQGGREQLARDEVVQCYKNADEAALRSLTPKTLYRLLALGRTFGLEFHEPRLKTLAHHLLPPDFRDPPRS